jgi:hypothetical protein
MFVRHVSPTTIFIELISKTSQTTKTNSLSGHFTKIYFTYVSFRLQQFHLHHFCYIYFAYKPFHQPSLWPNISSYFSSDKAVFLHFISGIFSLIFLLKPFFYCTKLYPCILSKIKLHDCISSVCSFIFIVWVIKHSAAFPFPSSRAAYLEHLQRSVLYSSAPLPFLRARIFSVFPVLVSLVVSTYTFVAATFHLPFWVQVQTN